MAVNGAGLAAIAAGSVFLYGGLKGYSIAKAFQNVVLGKSPGTGQNASSLTAGSAASGSGGGTGSGSPASGAPVTGGGNASQYQAYAFSLFPQYGWGADNQQPLVDMWNGESGWDPTAYNPGTHTTTPDDAHAFGIPQALPASKMASAGSDWRTNGYTQIRWGLGYIHGVYGSPAKAYAAWLSRSPHWY